MNAVYPITASVFQRLLPGGRMRVVDAGASGGGEFARWGMLNECLELYAFEPDAEECEHLRKMAEGCGATVSYYTDCLGKTRKGRPLYVSRERYNSSLLELDMDWYHRKAVYTTRGKIRQSKSFEIVERRYVDSISLDDWASINGVADFDYLKLDIEGAELELMTSSPATLEGLIGVSVDVIFHRDWKRAPVFGEIDEFMGSRGFGLMDLRSLKRNYQYDSPVQMLTAKGALAGQIACADALYLRDPIQFPEKQLSREKILKLAVAAEINGHADYAFEMLTHLLRREQGQAEADFLQRVFDDAAHGYQRLMRERRGLKLTDPVERLCRRVFPESWWGAFRPMARLSRRSAAWLMGVSGRSSPK